MKIRAQPMYGAEPQMCLSNVRKRVKALGGEVVFGWLVRDGGNGWKIRENHAVWRSPEGELVDVTPSLVGVTGEYAISTWSDETEFEQDDTAMFEEKNRPGQYIPPYDNPHLKRAAECMAKGDQAMNRGDMEACRYWTQKANDFCQRAGTSCSWEVPASAQLSDILKTM